LRRRAFVPFFLGLVWGVLLLVAVNLSALALVVLLVPVAALAALSIARASPGMPSLAEIRGRYGKGPKRAPARRRSRTKFSSAWDSASIVGVTAAVVCPLAGVLGPAPAFATAAIAACVAFALLVAARVGIATAVATSVAVCLPALGAGSIVAGHHQGTNEAFALVAGLCAYDAGSFLMGDARGALGGVAGVLGGVICVAVVAVGVAAALNPPFSGNRAWIAFGIVAVTAPLGVWSIDLLVGPRRMPAVRRVDSYVLAAPAWVAALPFVLHH
jgi:hypothetical protein